MREGKAVSGNAGVVDGPALDLAAERVEDYVHGDFVVLDGGLSVGEAIVILQRREDDGRILYFYVADAQGRLVGVMPARLFITRDPGKSLAEVCLRDIVAIEAGTSLLEAARTFEKHRFLSLPVVDAGRRIVGVLDLHVFTARKIDLSDRAVLEEVFQTIGVRLGGLVGAGPFRSWRRRFPWLLSTIAGGALCVLVTAAFESTLAASLVLAVFLAPILALGESTAIQSMSITLQILGLGEVRTRSALGYLAKEAATGLLLGLASGAIISALESVWKGFGSLGLVILASVACAMAAAAAIGFVLPWILHRFKVSLKVAAGPIVLAVADVSTILIYLGIASAVMAR